MPTTYEPQNLPPTARAGGPPSAPSLAMMNQAAQADNLRAPSRPSPNQRLAGSANTGGGRLAGPSRPRPVRGQGLPGTQGGVQRGGGVPVASRAPRTITPPVAARAPAAVNSYPLGVNRGPTGMQQLSNPGAGNWVSGPMNSRQWVPT